jgi:hypothetical protein
VFARLRVCTPTQSTIIREAALTNTAVKTHPARTGINQRDLAVMMATAAAHARKLARSLKLSQAEREDAEQDILLMLLERWHYFDDARGSNIGFAIRIARQAAHVIADRVATGWQTDLVSLEDPAPWQDWGTDDAVKLYLKKNDGVDAIVEVGPVRSVAGRTGAVALVIADVASLQSALDGKAASSHGHAISDVASLQASLDAKAPLASPALTGTPTAPTASAYTDSTQVATTGNVSATVKTVPENAQTGTSYTLALSDAGKLVTLSNAAAITLTIPTHASVALPVGTRIDLVQYGAGQVTLGGSGVIIRSSGSKLKLAGQYSGATLWKRGTNEWVLIGDITS